MHGGRWAHGRVKSRGGDDPEPGCWVAKPELVHFHESGKLGRAHVRCLLHKHREPDFLHVQRVASML